MNSTDADVHAESFKLCYPQWVQRVAALLFESKPGVTHAIYGRWGSGKTSACAALKRAVHDLEVFDLEKKSFDGDLTPVVWLDAVRLRDPSSSRAFLDEVTAQASDQLTADVRAWYCKLPDARKYAASVARYAKGLSPILVPIAEALAQMFGHPQLTKDERQAAEVATKGVLAAVADLLSPSSRGDSVSTAMPCKKIIIILDDLDRCQPDECLRILRNLPYIKSDIGINMVIACDPEVIGAHFTTAMGLEAVAPVVAMEAIAKYVDVPLILPIALTEKHIETVEKALQLRGTQVNSRDRPLLDAAIKAVGRVPIREILAAMPQARLWCRELSDDEVHALSDVLVCLALFIAVIPDFAAAMLRGGETFLRHLPRLFGHVESPDAHSRHTFELRQVFGQRLLEIFHRRPDLAALGTSLLGGWLSQQDLTTLCRVVTTGVARRLTSSSESGPLDVVELLFHIPRNLAGTHRGPAPPAPEVLVSQAKVKAPRANSNSVRLILDRVTFFHAQGLEHTWQSLVYRYSDDLWRHVRKAYETYELSANADADASGRLKPRQPLFTEFFQPIASLQLEQWRRAPDRLYHPDYFQNSREEERLDALLLFFNSLGHMLSNGSVELDDIKTHFDLHVGTLAKRSVVRYYLQSCRFWQPLLTGTAHEILPSLDVLLTHMGYNVPAEPTCGSGTRPPPTL